MMVASTLASSGLTSSSRSSFGLGRHDLQQRDDFAGVGQPVGDQREVGDLQEFFEPDSRCGAGFR